MITLGTPIQSLAIIENLSTRTLNVCENNGMPTLGDLLAKSDKELMSLPRCGAKTMSQIAHLRNRYGYLQKEGVLPGIQEELMADGEQDHFMSELDPLVTAAFAEAYRNNFKELPNVLRKKFAYASELDGAMSMLGEKSSTSESDAGRGKPGLGAFADFIGKRRDELRRIKGYMSDKPVHEARKESISLCLGSAYPFLTRQECLLFATLLMRGKDMPGVFLLEKCLRRSDNTAAIIYRTRYGMNDAEEYLTYKEAGERLGLTSERIRQYASHSYPYPGGLEKAVEGFRDAVGEINVSSSEDEIWSRLRKENMLSINEHQIMGLYTSINPEMTLIQFDEGHPYYLIRKGLLQNIRLKIGYARLKAVSVTRRVDDVPVSISKQMGRCKDSVLDPRSVELGKIMAREFRDCAHIDRENPDLLVFHATALNLQQEAAKLLAEHGKPMHYRDISRRLNERFPGMVTVKEYTLKQMLFLDKRFLPISRTGYYVLSKWKKYFTGSIIDFITRLLEKSEAPMTGRDLYLACKDNYPSTSLSSVESLINYDNGRRIAVLGNGYFGIAGRDYTHYDMKRQPRSHISEKAFEENFDRYCAYVRENGYFPTLSAGKQDKEGAALYLWRYNLRRGNRAATEEQLERMEKFESEHADLPHDGRELAFYQKYRKVMKLLKKEGKVSSRTNRSEYYWMRHVSQTLDTLSANCRRWGEEVMNFNAE